MGSPSNFCITIGGAERSHRNNLKKRTSGQGGDARYDGPHAKELRVIDCMLLIGSGACDVELDEYPNPFAKGEVRR